MANMFNHRGKGFGQLPFAFGRHGSSNPVPARLSAPALCPSRQLWLRGVTYLITAGLLYVGLQLADLSALHTLAEAATEGQQGHYMAYLPLAENPTAAGTAEAAVMPGDDFRVAEIGDGGDLGRRAQAMLASYQPLTLAQKRDNIVYVALGPLLERLGGELLWSSGEPRGSVLLSTALINFTLGHSTATRNFIPVELPAPPVEEYGQIRLPLQAFAQLCELQLESLTSHDNLFRLTAGDRVVHVLVREQMYNLEVSRSGRWLQVFFLGQPVKRYPLCTGRGNNTPVGHFRIQNKAVWPPWRAYWGEYMPGGSARNPLGARWLGTTARGREEGRAIGIHGTNQPSSIGQRISGGCLRTYNELAIELYNNIPVGTPVWIHE
jgi:hypothetical protein